MKQFILMFLSLLLLSACSFFTNEMKIENHPTSDPSEEIVTSPPVSSMKDMWMEAYTEAIVNIENKPRHIRLVDVDFDGIPEVFLSSLGASNSEIYHGFTYKEDHIIDISVSIPPDLELWQDKDTKALFWLAHGMYRGGSGFYHYIWYKIDFSDISAIIEDFFFGWEEDISSIEGAKYFLYDGYDSPNHRIEMTWDEIEKQKDILFLKYDRIECPYLFSFVNEFINGSDRWLTEDNLNKKLLFDFFSQWESPIE